MAKSRCNSSDSSVSQSRKHREGSLPKSTNGVGLRREYLFVWPMGVFGEIMGNLFGKHYYSFFSLVPFAVASGPVAYLYC